MIDTHTHLNDEKFDADLDDVIARARAAGITGMIVCGYDVQSSRKAIEIACRYEDVWATVGVHPHDAKSYADDTSEVLAELARRPGVVAIGETGLDFHYDFSPRPAQIAAFESQLELAARLEMPVVVHSRESNAESLEIVTRWMSSLKGCMFHCFSGDEHFAREALDAGCDIGVDGPVTYRREDVLRRVVEICPMDRLLIETDCPYLAPVPFRGKRNEPAYLGCIAQEVARVKSSAVEQIAEATRANARKLFRL